MTFDELVSPGFNEAELSDDNEDDVICKVALDVFRSGDENFARQIFNRDADRDPIVHFALFFSRAWPQPEVPPEVWDEALAEMRPC